MEFLAELGLFLAKAVIIVAAILLVVGGIARAGSRGERRGKLRVTKLNDRYAKMALAVREAVLPRKAYKQAVKARRIQEKAARKGAGVERAGERARVYVIDFKGNVRASQVKSLREEVTAILAVVRPADEVVVKIHSPGGLVHGYGLAASQLERIKARGVKLTVSVDAVAASGGYLMACVADHIVAAPFAIIGSIGVIAQIPNVHRLLKRHDVDVEMVTAGKWKRTLTVLGENTDEGRKKLQEEVNETHALFKGFVARFRSGVDIDTVATGEHWYGAKALELGLVDSLSTSDDYLVSRAKDADVFKVAYTPKKALFDRVSQSVRGGVAEGLEQALFRTPGDVPFV